MSATIPSHLAYLRPATLAAWPSARTDAWAADAAERGIRGLVTKLDAIDDDLRAIATRRGLELVGSFACYSDHAGTVLADAVRPIGLDGRRLPPIEWYTGVVPGDPAYDDALAGKLTRELASAGVDAVLLDFLRWPGHWETESRNAAAPRPASFDQGTLDRFADALGVPAIAPQRVADYAREWVDFRAHTITDAAERFASIIHGGGARVGAFLVPVPHGRRRTDYGQDAAALAAHVDFFAVMTYQQITGLDIGQTLALTDEIVALTGRDTIAMLQTTSSPEFSGGWDWGPPLQPADLHRRADLLDQAVRGGRISAVCCFPGEAALPDFTLAPLPEGTIR